MYSLQEIISKVAAVALLQFLNFTTFIINLNKVSPFDTARDDVSRRRVEKYLFFLRIVLQSSSAACVGSLPCSLLRIIQNL